MPVPLPVMIFKLVIVCTSLALCINGGMLISGEDALKLDNVKTLNILLSIVCALLCGRLVSG